MKWACYINYLLLGAILVQWVTSPLGFRSDTGIWITVFFLGIYHILTAIVLLVRNRKDRMLWYYFGGLVVFGLSVLTKKDTLPGFLIIVLGLYFTIVLHLKMNKKNKELQ